jgi:N-acetylglucosamine kinase-like BadF-type ATPase
MGDEGSAHAIARAGLTAAARAADGRGETTAILAQFQRELDARSPEGLIDRIYALDMTRERLANLAKIVFDAAPTDSVARQIIADAASDLAHMITTLGERLTLPKSGFTLALAGSVILNQALLREQMHHRLAAHGFGPSTTCLIAEPVRGALALARAMAT